MSPPDRYHENTSRPYRSAVREQRAADTRRRIATAAKGLFAERGFAGTTVADIAAQAGVAAPTVYATFGSKGAIVRVLLAQMEYEADAGGWVQRIANEPSPPAKLAAFATWTTVMLSSSKAMIRATIGAAADPAMNELREEGDRHRRHGLRALIDQLIQKDALSAELSEEHALDRAWLLTGVELYLSATNGCGWSDAEYEQWLTTLLQQQLLSRTPSE